MAINDKNIYKDKGFTLIELLVVISIIGFLATLAVVNINTSREKARNVKRRTDLKQIQTALELYYDKNGNYPMTSADSAEGVWLEGRCAPSPFPGVESKPDYTGANAYIPDLAPTYIAALPSDPLANPNTGICYGYSSIDGKNYFVWAHQGAEGAYDPSDPMIRLIGPGSNPSADCTQTQNTYVIGSKGRCAPPMP